MTFRATAEDVRRRLARRLLRARGTAGRPIPSYASMRALVTGSSSGIGAALATHLAECGAIVTGLDLVAPPNPVEGVDHVLGDVRDVDFSTFEPFDLIVANAGVADSSATGSLPDEALERLVSVNLTGAVRTIDAPKTDRARLILVSSESAVSTFHQGAVYGATKAAVLHLGYALGSRYPTTVALIGRTDTKLFEHRDRFRGLPSSPAPADMADPANVARAILEGARRGEPLVVTHDEVLPKLRTFCSWLLAADRSGAAVLAVGGLGSLL